MTHKSDLTTITLSKALNGFNGIDNRPGMCNGIAYALLFDIITREEKKPNSNAWKEHGSFMDIFMLMDIARDEYTLDDMQKIVNLAKQSALGGNQNDEEKSKVDALLSRHASYNALEPSKRHAQFYNDIMAYLDQITFFQSEQEDLITEYGMPLNLFCPQDNHKKGLILGKDIKKYLINHTITSKISLWRALTDIIERIISEENHNNNISVFTITSDDHVSAVIYQHGEKKFMLIDNDNYREYNINCMHHFGYFYCGLQLHKDDCLLLSQYQPHKPREHNTSISITLNIPNKNYENFVEETIYMAIRNKEVEILQAIPSDKLPKKELPFLHRAILTNDNEIVQIIKEMGYEDKYNVNFLHGVFIDYCTNGNLNHIKALMSYGLNINYTYNGLSPFVAALKSKQQEVIQYLAEKNWSVFEQMITCRQKENIGMGLSNTQQNTKNIPQDNDKTQANPMMLQNKSLFNSNNLKGIFTKAKKNKENNVVSPSLA